MIKIIKENNQIRCEICHKVDLFNQQNGTCLRCNEIKIELLVTEHSSQNNKSILWQRDKSIQEIIKLVTISGIVTFILVVINDLIHANIPNSFVPFTLSNIIFHAFSISALGCTWGYASLIIFLAFNRFIGVTKQKLKRAIIGTIIGICTGILLQPKWFCGNITNEEVILSKIFWLTSPTVISIIVGLCIKDELFNKQK